MGFTLPFEKWLQQNLRTEVFSTLTDAARVAACGLDTKAVQKIWNTFLVKPGSVGWTRPWSLYVLVKWCELNRVTV